MDGGSSFADHFKRAAPEGSRSGGRRKSRGGASAAAGNEPKKKKTPQRGMGVAQLERLRLQADHQRLKMNSNNNPLSVNVTVPAIVHHAPPIVFSPAAACGGGGAAMINGAAAIPFQFPLSAAAASLGGCHHDLYGFGNYSNLFHAGNVKENSKELSSTPNFTFNPPPSLSDHHHQICNVCHKKKRGNDGNLGYNQWVNIIGEETQEYPNGFNPKQFLHVGFSDKGLMKGSCSSAASKGMKEYEFFPAERNSSEDDDDDDDDVVMMRASGASESSSPVAVVAAAAAMASSGEASFDASNSSTTTTTTTIDLSLRLSY